MCHVHLHRVHEFHGLATFHVVLVQVVHLLHLNGNGHQVTLGLIFQRVNALIKLVARFKRLNLLNRIIKILHVLHMINLDILLHFRDEVERCFNLGDILLQTHITMLYEPELLSVLVG